jgi:hypothetical protein
MRNRVPILLVVTAITTAALAAAAAPVGYHPVPFPDATQRTMPTAREDGTYCVRLLDYPELAAVDVPHHYLDPLKRDELNRKYRAGGVELGLSTDPGVIVAEYRASVQNAFQLLALQSGDARLIEASHIPLRFVDLGDPEPSPDTARKKPVPTSTCMKSSCFGKPPSCIPTGCSGGCADCIGIKIIAY